MNITLSKEALAAVRKAGATSHIITDERDDWHGRTISLDALEDKDVGIVKEVLRRSDFWKDIDNRRAVRRIEAVEALAAGGKQAKITKLELLPEAIKRALASTPHRWLFVPVAPFGALLPFFVREARFFPPERRGEAYIPAHVVVSLSAASRGTEDERKFEFKQDAMGKAVEDILATEEAVIETEALVKDHAESLVRYRRYAPQMGEQFLARGTARVLEGRWSRGGEPFEQDGAPAKVVMDDEVKAKGSHSYRRDDDTFTGFVSTKFWAKGKPKHGDDEDYDDEAPGKAEESFELPVHPVVRVFNLGTHEFAEALIDDLEPYPYDEAVRDKLVLPTDHRELIDTLMLGAARRMDDIVRGKARGVIVLASGPPGTGKTLTAEVYSEVAKRPLYAVQCSQLGTTEEELEKRLTEVLERANRWRAILLIDEADVYIHERGADIQQNAIVGIFLRLLEYFNGVLFMTTNRATIVDDAILSRMTAHVKYGIPLGEQAAKIWKVLAKQYGVKDLSVEAALDEFHDISGRSIRQLIRLGIAIADKRGEKFRVEHLKAAAKFHDFTERE